MNNLIERLLKLNQTGASPQSIRALRESRERADYEIEWGDFFAALQDACISVMQLCDAELEIVRRNRERQIIEFSREKQRWTREVEKCTPHLIPDQVGKSRLYTLSGVAALLIEFFLSAYVMRASDYGWIASVTVSGVVTGVLAVFVHGLIKLATERETPRQTAEIIKKRVAGPFLFVTLPSLAIFLFVRVLSGGGAEAASSEGDWFGISAFLNSFIGTLSSLFDFALWLATLGLVPLGASLLALGELYGWSVRASEAFDQTERRTAELKNIRAKYHTVMRRRSERPQAEPEPRSPLHHTTAPYLMLLLALGLPLGLSACTPHQKKAHAPASHAKPAVAVLSPAPVSTGAAGTELHLKIDRSGSIDPQAATAAADKFFRQLPALLEAIKAVRLGIAYFTNKGWNAPETVDIALPSLAQLEAPRVQGGRLPQHIQERIALQNEKAQAKARQEAQARYREELRQALAPLTSDALNAASKASAPCTDLLGVLSRIGAAEYSGRQIFVIVTDGISTCKQKTPLTAPRGDVRVLVLLATALPGESEGEGGTDQYFSREAALKKMAPWLTVMPADTGDLVSALKDKSAPEKLAGALP